MVVIRTHITTLAAPELPPSTGEAYTMGTLNHRPRTPGRRPWAMIDAVASKSITPRKIPTVLMPTEHPRRLGARQIKSAARSSSNLFAALPRRPRPGCPSKCVPGRGQRSAPLGGVAPPETGCITLQRMVRSQCASTLEGHWFESVAD